MPALQDRLPGQGDHDGMLHVMVQGVGIGNDLQGQMGGPDDDIADPFFHIAVGPLIGFLELLPAVVGFDFLKVEHAVPPVGDGDGKRGWPGRRGSTPFRTMNCGVGSPAVIDYGIGKIMPC